MTDDIHIGDAIDSPERFNAALTALIEQATEHGVDVTGAWECYSEGDAPNWETVVVELDNQHADD